MQEKRSNKAKQLKISYDKVFSSDDGRDVLFDLMDSCNFMGSSLLDSQSYEPLAMAFRDGQKMIVSRILQTLNTSTEQFMKLTEQKQQEEGDFNYEE